MRTPFYIREYGKRLLIISSGALFVYGLTSLPYHGSIMALAMVFALIGAALM